MSVFLLEFIEQWNRLLAWKTIVVAILIFALIVIASDRNLVAQVGIHPASSIPEAYPEGMPVDAFQKSYCGGRGPVEMEEIPDHNYLVRCQASFFKAKTFIATTNPASMH
ncbi:MAG: hypothetical protein ACRYGK_07810 [Janthinobacterium lividum]